MLRFSEPGRRTRWVIIFYGLVVFIWQGREDNHIWPVALLGASGATLMVWLWTARRLHGQLISKQYVALLFSLMGAAAGFGASLLTATLMLFKNARHAHLFQDYPNGLMGAILQRAPLWALAGMLIGLGLTLFWWVSTRE